MRVHNKTIKNFQLSRNLYLQSEIKTTFDNNFDLDQDYKFTEFNQGINNFDVIYFINLEHRHDRLEHIQNELKRVGVLENKIVKINAVNLPNFPSLGCSRSHINAIEHFIKDEKYNNCIILEDDFMFNLETEKVDKILNIFLNYIKDWDILSLASNVKICKDSEYDLFKRLIDGQTTSGYCLNRKFAQNFLTNIKQGASVLEKVGKMCHEFSIDIFMKRLQPVSKWYISCPLIGKQINSYSDIEKKVVNYNC